MTSEPLLTIADEAIFRRFGRRLTDVETAILLGALADQTYEQIAADSGYSVSYVKRDVGPKLWRSLSHALSEDISKTNFRMALARATSQSEHATAMDVSLVDRSSNSSTKTPETLSKIGDSAARELEEEIYVERSPTESICYETLLQPGSLIRIKAPRLMGKTSLINRVLSQIEREGYRLVSLSFELADKSIHFRELHKFMRWFCATLSRELGLPNKIDEYWEDELGAKISCTTYLEDYLLPQANAPIVLGLDDVDLLFPHPTIYEDFFSLLRAWHEKAKSRPIWKRLRLLLAHTTDVYIPLDINQSPFNVGTPIELSEFTTEQVESFAQQFGLENRLISIEPLINMVGGHPYLLEQAFTYLKNYPLVSLEHFLDAAPTEAGIYHHHLRDHWLTLQKYPELMNAFKAIVSASTLVAIEPNTTYHLQCMGLVKFVGNQVTPRCKLYQQYFSARL
jgi:hypothetical protein